MSPAKQSIRRKSKANLAQPAKSNGAKGGDSDEWALAMYQTASGDVPSETFLLQECPDSVQQMLLAIVVAVKEAPPPRFPTSHLWHVMRDDMKGLHEARDEHDGTLYRLFCVVDRRAPQHGLDAPVVALICGGTKPVRSKMEQSVYDQAQAYRDEYVATRRILLPPGMSPSVLKEKS
jgi:hypothetical protein